jgi:hypothetical protein
MLPRTTPLSARTRSAFLWCCLLLSVVFAPALRAQEIALAPIPACTPPGPGNPANFEIDGNLLCNTLEDWFTISGCSAVLLNSPFGAPNPLRIPSLFVRDSTATSIGPLSDDISVFAGTSNKNDDLIGSAVGQHPWTWDDGSTPPKDDLTEVYIHARVGPGIDPATGLTQDGHLWLMLANAHASTDGDKHTDYEFNQAGIQQTGSLPAGGKLIGLGANGGRTTNKDFIISIDYTNGGTQACVTLRRWNGSAYVTPLFPGLPQDSVPAGISFTAVNLVSVPVPGSVFGTGSGYNVTDHYDPLQFVEVALDLTAFLPDLSTSDLCHATSTVMVKTRSSQSFTAELKDFVLAPFTIVQPPDVHITGPDAVCAGGPSVQFCEDASGAAQWNWTLGTNPGGIASFDGPSNTQCVNVLFTAAGTCTLTVAVITADGCTNSTKKIVTVTNPAVAVVPTPARQCVAVGAPNSFSLVPTTCSGGTPAWTQISGPAVTFGTPGACNTTASFTGPGTAVIRLTVTPAATCPPVFQDVTLLIDARAAVVVPTPDRQCVAVGTPNSFTLAPTTCSGGTPAWTQISGPAVTFGTPGACGTTASFTGPGSAVVRLTVTPSVAGSACPAVFQDVTLLIDARAAVVVPTPDRQCVAVGTPNSFTLAPTTCSGGTPAWTQISGPAVTFGTPGACGTTASFTGPGTAVVRLTVTPSVAGSACPAVFQDVTLLIDARAAVVVPTPDRQCVAVGAPNSFSLVPTTCSGGTPAWTQISGPAVIFGSAGSCNTTASFTGPGTAVVRLTVTPSVAGSACPAVFQDVTLQIDAVAAVVVPTPARQCVAVGAPNTFTLVPTTCTGGTPAWTQISGPAVIFGSAGTCNTTASFTGPGTAVIRLTVTPSAAGTVCPAVFQDVTLLIDARAAVVVPAPDRQCVAVGAPNTFTLAPTTCSGGTPLWTQISGPVVNFGTPGACGTTASFTGPGTAVVRLTVTPSVAGSACPAVFQDVTLLIDARAAVVVPAPARQCVAVSGPNSFSLVPTTCTGGTPAWTQISGPAVIFGSAGACNTTASFTGPGTAVVRLTVTPSVAGSACPAVFQDVTLIIDPKPVCTLLRIPDPLPQCASPGNDLCVSATGAANYFWYVTSTDAGWRIDGSNTGSCIKYTAGNGGTVARFHVILTSDQGCVDSCSVEFGCTSSSDFCTLTQGAYNANSNGKFNGETRIEFVSRVITPGSPLVIGVKTSVNAASCGSISFVDGSEQCLLNRMPSGGQPVTFPAGLGDQTLTLANGCTAGILTFKNDRFDNVFIGQLVALSLNARLDGNLGGMPLCNVMVSAPVTAGPDGKLGTADDICGTTGFRTVYISQRVLDALTALGLPKTVTGLIALANRSISCLPTGTATAKDIAGALGSINEGFDECRCLVQCGNATDAVSKVTGGASNDLSGASVEFRLMANSPNPFNHTTMLRFALPEVSRVKLSVFNILGQEIAVLANGEFSAGVQSIEWNAQNRFHMAVAPGVYFTRMQATGMTSGRQFTQTQKMLFVK